MSQKRAQSQLAQLNRLSHALRNFGLVDEFGIRELITGGAAPSVDVIARRLRKQIHRIPAGVSVVEIATYVVSEIRRVAPIALDASEHPILLGELATPLDENDIAALTSLKPGNAGSTVYQKIVGRIIGKAFEGDLLDGKLEVNITGGRRRVDIVFRNAAEEGFFSEIRSAHGIFAPRVWIECKNYTKDPKNEEVDQIGGRLGVTRGKFGILACREPMDRQDLIQRIADVRNSDQKWIVLLTDSDLVALVRASLEGDRTEADRLLRSRFEDTLYA